MSRIPSVGRRRGGNENVIGFLVVAALVIAVVVAIVTAVVAIVTAIVNWITAHILAIGLVLGAALAAYLGFRYYQYKQQRDFEARQYERARAFEESQAELGLLGYTNRHGERRWGTAQEVESWRASDSEEAELEVMVTDIENSIRAFSPQRYDHELPYHAELTGWLKAKYADRVEHEIGRGSSRPDLVIQNVAIEVKGPTLQNALASLSDKCNRYSTHYKAMILVLFDVRVSESLFDEWERSLRPHHPNVRILRIAPKGEGARQTWAATCADCGAAFRIKFKPRHSAPLRCPGCYRRHKTEA